MSTIGRLSGLPPIEPRNRASPNANTPPSSATSQYPFPLGVASIPVTGLRNRPCGSPKSRAAPNALTAAVAPCRHGALWFAVAFAVAAVVVQVGSHSHGGMHVATRHTTGPTHATSWWHCPYRKLLHATRRWSQSFVPQWHFQSWHPGAQMPLDPQPHDPHVALQSRM
ncbi:MAG: hypothetical protein KatS3mg010_1647 [Acidimicrobiia bacterium]|nr:MAG: hypothetical protein KatS3mg010_1647 [Acidimicrobiia bacterium]